MEKPGLVVEVSQYFSGCLLLCHGYRTWYALGWVTGLLVLGTFLFNYFYSTIDLLLPVASLHQ
jgi:hypothetical protein